MSARPQAPSRLQRNLVFVAVGVVFLWAVAGVGIKWDRLLNLPERLIDIFGRMFLPPDWSFLPLAVEAMTESLAMAWIGTVIGAALSLPMGFLAARIPKRYMVNIQTSASYRVLIWRERIPKKSTPLRGLLPQDGHRPRSAADGAIDVIATFQGGSVPFCLRGKQVTWWGLKHSAPRPSP